MDRKQHTGTATAVAQPNIALVKYWGKRDARLNLPAVPSLSVTLDTLRTRTTVAFDPELDADRFTLDGIARPEELARVSAVLDLLRQRAGVATYAVVTSDSNFPTAAGLASSASGFAALVTAADAALGLDLEPAVRSALARQGSGSAARSVFGGYVRMQCGVRDDGLDAVAAPLAAAEQLPLEVVIAVTSIERKTVGSTDGMEHTARTAPYWAAWVEDTPADVAEAAAAVLASDFDRLARISEHSCLKMHGLAMSADPGLIYWNGATVECLHAVRRLRQAGIPVFFTVDAGPQVKALCLPGTQALVAATLGQVDGVRQVLKCGLGQGARLAEPSP